MTEAPETPETGETRAVRSVARNGSGHFVRTVEDARKQERAYLLSAQGWSLRQIAEELGYQSRGTASVAIKRHLVEVAKPASRRSSASTSTWSASTTSCSPTSARASSGHYATLTPKTTTNCPLHEPGRVRAVQDGQAGGRHRRALLARLPGRYDPGRTCPAPRRSAGTASQLARPGWDS
jgi:AraC-like DNA-binding protein